MFDVTLDRELCDAIKLRLKSDSSTDGIGALNWKLIIFWGLRVFIQNIKMFELISLDSTMKDLFNSIEIKYFGGDCSITLEFSQFLDML